MNQAGLGLREVKFGILLPSAAALVCGFFLRWLNRTRIAPHAAAWKFVPLSSVSWQKQNFRGMKGQNRGFGFSWEPRKMLNLVWENL